MTEKRFWILNVLTKSSGIKDGDKLLSFDEVVDLLNMLHEENQQLQKQNKKLKEENRRLQFRTVDMLDFIKARGTVTHQEMKDWWNVMMKGDVE